MKSTPDERSPAIVRTDTGRELHKEPEKIPVMMMKKFDMDLEELMGLHASVPTLIAAAEQGAQDDVVTGAAG